MFNRFCCTTVRVPQSKEKIMPHGSHHHWIGHIFYNSNFYLCTGKFSVANASLYKEYKISHHFLIIFYRFLCDTIENFSLKVFHLIFPLFLWYFYFDMRIRVFGIRLFLGIVHKRRLNFEQKISFKVSPLINCKNKQKSFEKFKYCSDILYGQSLNKYTNTLTQTKHMYNFFVWLHWQKNLFILKNIFLSQLVFINWKF